MDVNPEKLNAFMGKMLGDMGAAANAALIRIGDRLGLYKELAANGPMTPADLAEASGTTERYVREWLSAQAAAGYVDYDATTGKFHMQPEQKMAFADEDSPVFIGAIGDVMSAIVLDEPKFQRHSRPARALAGTIALIACSAAPRVSSVHPTSITWSRNGSPHWMVWSRNSSAAPKSPDVGCGHGISTRLMAKAFPNSQFFGFDAHPGSIDAARKAARKEGFGERLSFATATAKTFPSNGYDLVCFFDCLVGALAL